MFDLFLKFIKVIFVYLVITQAQLALATSQNAQSFIEKVSGDAVKIVSSEVDFAKKEDSLRELFGDSVDYQWMGKFSMGRFWRTATQEQKDEYQKYYKKFLINSYVPKFKEYTNQKIIVQSASEESANEYLVKTDIKSKGATPIKVSYKVRKSDNGEYLIYDVIAEGISLITTQRSDFASILSRGGVKSLIKKLKAKSQT